VRPLAREKPGDRGFRVDAIKQAFSQHFKHSCFSFGSKSNNAIKSSKPLFHSILAAKKPSKTPRFWAFLGESLWITTHRLWITFGEKK
jgi:hypothetical protein